MKKIIVLLLLAITDVQAQAQLLQGEGLKANQSAEIGLIGGALGINDDLSSAALGFNLIIKGFYADLLLWPRAHANSTDVDKHEDEKTAFGIHAGYHFPLTKWLSVIPIVGYAEVKNGTTYGSKYTISNGNINNSYDVKDKNNGFDYGGLLCFHINAVRLYAAGTRFGVYGGIGIGF